MKSAIKDLSVDSAISVTDYFIIVNEFRQENYSIMLI